MWTDWVTWPFAEQLRHWPALSGRQRAQTVANCLEWKVTPVSFTIQDPIEMLVERVYRASEF
jgi:hypothetical protein